MRNLLVGAYALLSRTALLSRRALLVLLGATLVCYGSLTFRPFSRSPSGGVTHRTLTFEERVSYQRAIEEVYWRHRSWPAERSDPKPSLDAVMPRAQLEEKVQEYLDNSRALEHYWQRPITAEQLQAELNRIANETKQPEVLRELHEALGNDPLVIAECLARSTLTERLLKEAYAYDERIHGELRQRARSDLLALPSIGQMKQTSGTYSEIDFVRSDDGELGRGDRAAHAVAVNGAEWDETVQKVAAGFNKRSRLTSDRQETGREGEERILAGQVGALEEDETGYYATGVVEKAEDRLRLATVRWPKEPVESWRKRAEKQFPAAVSAPRATYDLPAIANETSGCFDGTAWASTSLNVPVARELPPAVWTGSEVIIWGGYGGRSLNTGGRYNPSTDAWTTTSTSDAPSPRAFHTVVWTGSEVIVWGGGQYDGRSIVPENTGGRYNPATDTWKATTTTNAPTARAIHTAVWTGSKMVVWGGGSTSENNIITGGRYDPDTDTWASTSTTNAPAARMFHTAVWTGSEMIIWGGSYDNVYFDNGARYNPSSDLWVATGTGNAPTGRVLHTAVWTGSEMIVWGGRVAADGGTGTNTGGRYNPGTNSWTATSLNNAPLDREYHTAVWTGSVMVVWGGWNEDLTFLSAGGVYNPSTDSWTTTSAVNAPAARWKHAAVWTGTEMIVWGGNGNGPGWLSRGGRYDPSTNSWLPDSTAAGRISHTAVWTGSEMIVWGGDNGYSDLDSGGKYYPATDSWTPTSRFKAPSARERHTAVWTGKEMIVWGGSGDIGALNTGGRYDPGADSWTATSVTNAPSARAYHTAVWAGGEMIVWGGHDSSANMFNSGGRYDPDEDSWVTTSTANAPAARSRHTAVWTGTEMVVWGGGIAPFFENPLNTGGRYSPSADTWTAMSTDNAPPGRYIHTAVWTGRKMIVWGGSNDVSHLNTGATYNPATDSWAATSMNNAPVARGAHTAVWTGEQMIIWGGGADVFPYVLNTGGRYDLGANLWSRTNTTNNVPTGRHGHTAVWTGAEMIVWGGLDSFGWASSGGRYCGDADRKTVRLANISTRAFVQTGDDVMIGGFIVNGTGVKNVILRALGPSLSNRAVPNALQDPVLHLHDSTGALIASNDNWVTAPNKQAIIDSGVAPSNDRESAILTSLSPGSYTAVLRGLNNSTGTALVEAYDLGGTADSKFANISTRASVQAGDNVMIGGIIVTGSKPLRAVVRAIGPSLRKRDVADALANPTLQLHDGNGALITLNDNWVDAVNKQAIVDSGVAPEDDLESAILTRLNPGSYTAVVRGVNNSRGVALVEVFALD